MSRSRKPSHLHPATDRSLTAYAMAAAAAGVSVLAASAPANAEVVFTPVHTMFNNGTVSIDLNHDGVSDFVLSIYNFIPEGKRMAASGLGRNGVAGYILSGYPPLAVPLGDRIGPALSFFNREAPAVNVVGSGENYIGGPFANVGLRFFGLEFEINGKVHFGWAAVVAKARLHSGSPHIEASLLGYAYETEPGKAIIAGDTGTAQDEKNSDLSPVPEGLGYLALGWRWTPPNDKGNE